jgi:hypothetical protein
VGKLWPLGSLFWSKPTKMSKIIYDSNIPTITIDHIKYCILKASSYNYTYPDQIYLALTSIKGFDGEAQWHFNNSSLRDSYSIDNSGLIAFSVKPAEEH